MEPTFDWVPGKIDVSLLSPDAPIDPDLIIADVVRLTGIPEPTSPDSFPGI